MGKGLHIPKRILITASGIDESVIRKDEKNGSIRFENGFIGYEDALKYVDQKWKEGKVLMYAPYSDDLHASFSARMLSRLDDEIAVENLKIEWKK